MTTPLDLTDLTPDVTANVLQLARDNAVEIMSMTAIARRMAIGVDAAEAVRRSIDPRALGLAILEAAADRDDAATIIATTPTPNTAGLRTEPRARPESPLIAAAKSSAAEALGRHGRR